MEHMKLHHVGIVMNSQERADRFMKKFGLETDYMEYVLQIQLPFYKA